MNTPKNTLCLCALLLLASVSPLLAVQSSGQSPQIIVATWELNQQVGELRQDIQVQQGSVSQLFDRCLRLFQKHPQHLIQTQNRFASVQEVILDDLSKQELLVAWQEHIALAAEDQLSKTAPGDLQGLLSVAHSFPRSQAAEHAWQQLADTSWDRGHIGNYLYYAQQAQRNDSNYAEREKKRMGAALNMVRMTNTVQKKSVPTSLAHIDVMWSENLPTRTATNNKRQTAIRNGRIVHLPSRSNPSMVHPYLTSHGDDSVLALNNGSHLLIIDPLLGRKLGDIHNIGSPRRNIAPSQSYVGNGIILTNTFTNEGHGLLACNADGALIWRNIVTPSRGSYFVSRPIILDNTAFIAFISYANDSERLELAAFNVHNGKEKWRRLLAQMNGANARYNRGQQNLNPDICIHRGQLAILSNRGVIAQCTANGQVLSLSSYPRHITVNEFGQFDRSISSKILQRHGRIRSDGTILAVAPSDSDKLLVNGTGTQQYQFLAYQGTGQQGDLLDFKNGTALMIGRQIRMLDLNKGTLLWSQAVSREKGDTVWGRIGEKHSLVSASKHVKLYDNTDGHIQASHSIEKNHSVAMHDKMLLFIGQRTITGRGDSASFEKELSETIARDPKNYHAHISFAVLREAQGKNIAAFHHYLTGLSLGAPTKYSEYAALLLRPHLNIQLDSDAFSNYIVELAQLQKIDPKYQQEVLWWRARHSESRGRTQQAITQYTELLTQPTLDIQLSNKMSADTHFMARSSIQRLQKNEKRIQFNKNNESHTDTSRNMSLLQAWHIDGGTTIEPLCTERYIIAYVNGFLRCIDARNGKELWRQNGEMSLPMLGIGSSGQNRISILKGMAAEWSGMKTGDAITSFNGKSVNEWTGPNGIATAVGAAKPGSEFTVTVLRNGTSINLTGTLGSRPMQAIQHNAHTVLTQYINIRQDQRNPGLYFPITDTTNTPHIQLYDLESGTLLWHHTLTRQSLTPLLTNHDLLIEAVGVDLIARDIRDPQHTIRWLVKGAAQELANGRIEQGMLIGVNRSAMRAHIRNHQTGASIASIPINPDYNFTLHGDLFLATLPDGNLALWRLSTAEMLWTAQEPFLQIIATAKNTIYCRNAQGHIFSLDSANGLIHRRYPQWSQISHYAVNNDTLYIVARSQRQKMTAAAIHIPTGNINWQHPLSDDLQFLNTILATHNGAYFKFGQAPSPSNSPQKTGFLHISRDGNVTSFTPSNIYDRHGLVGNELVLQGFSGLRIAPAQDTNSSNKNSKSIHCQKITPTLSKQKDFKKFTRDWTQDKKYSWQEINGHQYLFAYSQDALFIARRFPKQEQEQGQEAAQKWNDIYLRIADGGPIIDLNSSLLHIQNEKSTMNKNSAWSLSASSEYQDESGTTVKSWKLTMPQLRAPSLPILIHIQEKEQNPDFEQGIWWLHRNWHRVSLID